MGYHKMTPIQAESLPLVLDNKDVIAQAKTGSGKTAAFGLGLLDRLDVSLYRVQSLVLCPTRELADQVAKEIRKLARSIHNIKVLTLCGGMPFGPQIGSLEHGAHIIVGTPGRVEEHIRKNNLSLDHLRQFVLDEADRMLDMGFQEAIDTIVEQMPSQRQTLLFSATYPEKIQTIAARLMNSPHMVKVASTHDEHSIEQIFYSISPLSRTEALAELLLHHRPNSTVVFCNTKRETELIAHALEDKGLIALALHGDLEQKTREQLLVRFANKSASVLVATDVAARGLDIESLDAVINFEIARDLEVHVHRIGRTGRAGNQGIALTLVDKKDDYKLNLLADFLQQPLSTIALPNTHQQHTAFKPPMVTLQIDGGKKQKVRPGDILGALTGKNGIDGKAVGKIHIFDNCAYVAVTNNQAQQALNMIKHGKLKGRSFRVREV